MEQKRISFLNLKGGVGKTTSAICLAYMLAQKYNVLLIDLDKQGNASRGLGVYSNDERYIGSVLLNPKNIGFDVIKQTEWGIDVISSNLNLATVEQQLKNDVTLPQQNRLQMFLDRIDFKYDYVIIDCPPALDILIINALYASTEVLVPVKIDQWSVDGLEAVFDLIGKINSNYECEIKMKCYATMLDKQNKTSQKYFNQLKKEIGDYLLDVTIPISEGYCRQQSFYSKPLPLIRATAPITKAYEELVKKI